MKTSVALLASSIAAADVVSGDANANLRRQLSYDRVAGYVPGSQVTDHCAIDLDQAAMEAELAKKTPESFERAREIYNNGGNSKAYATVTIEEGLKSRITKGTAIIGKNEVGGEVAGKAYADFDKDATSIQVQYATSDVQRSYVGCQVGSLPENFVNTQGCFKNEGVLNIEGAGEHSYAYEPMQHNSAGRTIAGFSQSAGDKMLRCANCPYEDFQYFYKYYGKEDYAHDWVEAAFEGGRAGFTKGDADFSEYSLDGKEQAIKKGSAYLNIFMYVIREFEDALDDCQAKCLDCNDSSVHAWDEGVCFFTGSMEGKDGAGDGNLLYALADKRCGNFRTCGEEGTDLEGTAKVNHDLFDLFSLGNYQLQKGECGNAGETRKKISDLMYIPMIQGTLRYAYKVGQLQGGEVEMAEGATFAAAVLPKVHAMDPAAAQIIYDNMRVGAPSTDFVAVKNAFESVYSKMGITCEDVGGLWFEGTGTYYEGMEPCNHVKVSSAGALRLGLGAISTFCMSAFLYFGL